MKKKTDALVDSISEDAPIEWSGPDLPPDGDDEARRLEALKNLSAIAQFNRRLQRSPDADPAPGAPDGAEPKGVGQWGPLVLMEKIGEGSHGEVWRAWEGRLKRTVALKFLKASDPEAGRRLLEEGSHLAGIRHSGVAQVHGIETHDGRIGLWMEWLDGETLDEIVARRGTLSGREAALIGIELCRTLASVHHGGLLHRDVKASNVVRTRGGRIVLNDFGLGRRIDESGSDRVSGTPMYMAPEVLDGRATTTASDLYSLGVLLYFLVTGRYPFDARTVSELKAARRAGHARRLRDERPDLPARFIGAVEQALAENPEDRYRSAGEMEAALAEVVAEGELSGPAAPAGHRPRSVRKFPAPLAVLIALATIAGGLSYLFSRPADNTPLAGHPDYEVEASFILQGDAGYEPLVSGNAVAPGDRLSLDFQASEPLHVYVLNEDDSGESYLLFPGPAYDLGNPLPEGITHRIPGTIAGNDANWKVTSAGGREHFLIVASPEPLPGLERELAGVDVPRVDRPVTAAPLRLRIPAGELLRGVGGLEMSAAAANQPRRMTDIVRGLAGREAGVSGVWIRKVVLENPGN
jgi:hypothetical protein